MPPELTVRDYFAAMAMQELMRQGEHWDLIPKLAYHMAEKVLKEREKYAPQTN